MNDPSQDCLKDNVSTSRLKQHLDVQHAGLTVFLTPWVTTAALTGQIWLDTWATVVRVALSRLAWLGIAELVWWTLTGLGVPPYSRMVSGIWCQSCTDLGIDNIVEKSGRNSRTFSLVSCPHALKVQLRAGNLDGGFLSSSAISDHSV